MIHLTLEIYLLKNSKEEAILGLTIDNKRSFDNHVKKICRKASQKTCALSRRPNCLDSEQKEILFKGMIRSQFSYCSRIWLDVLLKKIKQFNHQVK